MRRIALCLGAALAAPAVAAAQTTNPPLAVSGIRLDIVATGEVTRAPDLVTVAAGVTTRAAQAEAALRDNAQRMQRVRAALARLGISPRDIQTGTISLNQDYERPAEPSAGGRPQPSFYVATNQLTIRLRDIANAGRIIDALVAQGVNNVQGPSFGLEDREPALDAARARALAAAQKRADLYARSLGTRVRRIVAISEAGPPGIMFGQAAGARAEMADASTPIEPGEQLVATSVTVTFELDQPGR